MIDNSVLITSFFAFSVALAISFAMTPIVKLFAKKVGAIDVPKDARRMHKVPIPRLGGLAIFLGFLISILLFGRIDPQMKSILLGAVFIVMLGVVDDIHPLKPLVKFAGQIVAALIPVLSGRGRFHHRHRDGVHHCRAGQRKLYRRDHGRSGRRLHGLHAL